MTSVPLCVTRTFLNLGTIDIWSPIMLSWRGLPCALLDVQQHPLWARYEWHPFPNV